MNYTKGPWRISGFEVGVGASNRVVMGADGFSIAHVGERDADENDANAHLIAAARELLEVARIEQELHMGGYTKATAKRLGNEAMEAYAIGGVPFLNDWRRQKREAAIAKAESR